MHENALCMRTHTRGMHTHTSCMRTYTYAQKRRFRVLTICLFLLVLIICLGLVKSSFHMFSIRVSRITYLTLKIVNLDTSSIQGFY